MQGDFKCKASEPEHTADQDPFMVVVRAFNTAGWGGILLFFLDFFPQLHIPPTEFFTNSVFHRDTPT